MNPPRSQVRIPFRCIIFSLSLFAACVTTAPAQQPFITDDADVTARGHLHFEFSSQLDLLQRSAHPSLKQNTSEFELVYGLFEHVEVGVAVPWITIFNASGAFPKTISGIGDTNISLKYNFLREREGSHRPALSIGMNLELPTGDTARQLGSGLADFYINGILQKSLTNKTKLRINGGVLFSGNETTGALGIRARGTVLTSGASLVREFTPNLQLGVEVTGAQTKNFLLGQGQLQTLVGGNYQLRENLSFDFGLVAGKYDASPRLGVQLGLSIDF